LARQLARRNFTVAPLHGNRSQSQRERALSDLKRGRIQILVATDIASRGIDVEGLTHVVNYDVPHTPEDYVHRIGRTGRVDAIGDAFTLMSPDEQKDVTAIERFLGRTVPRVLLPDFDYKMRPREIADSVRTQGGHGGRHGHGLLARPRALSPEALPVAGGFPGHARRGSPFGGPLARQGGGGEGPLAEDHRRHGADPGRDPPARRRGNRGAAHRGPRNRPMDGGDAPDPARTARLAPGARLRRAEGIPAPV